MIGTTTYTQRQELFQKNIPNDEVWLLANAADIHYLTGFISLVPEEREAFLALTCDTQLLIHASFSPPPPQTSHLSVKTSVGPSALVSHLNDFVANKPIKSLRADLQDLTAHEYQALQAGGYQPLTLDRNVLWQQRMIKDEEEISLLREAGSIARVAFQQLEKEISTGQSEIQVARRLEVLMLENGSEKPAFPTIVAFGDHGALPHHQPTTRLLEQNMPILIDFGATVAGYRSDMTRSWWFGDKPTAEFEKVAAVVRTSYQKALTTSLQPNVTVADVDTAARHHITQASYGENFIHTTGHGVGLEIHEPPSVYHTQSQPLQAGMVITIEPGIYLQGSFGYRYENTVLIGDATSSEFTV